VNYLKDVLENSLWEVLVMEKVLYDKSIDSSLKESKKKFCYSEFCDYLFSLPVEERNDYVVSLGKNYSDLKIYFQRYKSNNGVYSDQTDDFLINFKQFYDNRRKQKSKELLLKNYEEGCNFFDKFVDLGFYSISDYMSFYNNKYDYHKNSLIIKKFKENIKKYDLDSWKEYELCIEENRKKTFLILKDRITLFISKLKMGESFDIIDYYMLVGVPIDSLIKLCNGFISDYDIVFIKKFVRSYKSTRLLNYCQFSYDDPNYEEKNIVVQFLYNNNIPFEYFNCALAKYYSGGLEQYIGKSKKIASL
jgi:hypothetical protein